MRRPRWLRRSPPKYVSDRSKGRQAACIHWDFLARHRILIATRAHGIDRRNIEQTKLDALSAVPTINRKGPCRMHRLAAILQ